MQGFAGIPLSRRIAGWLQFYGWKEWLNGTMFDTVPDKYEGLLEQVKHGPLPSDEVEAIASELQKPWPDTDRYTLVYLLGRGGDASYKSLVEPYLEGPDDMLARLALWVLCWYWGLAADYTEHLLRFMRGVYWDHMEQCRLAALAITGDYLAAASASDHKLLRQLITTCENKGEDQTIRAHAYSALSTALGLDNGSHALPFHEDGFNLDAYLDPAVLLEAKSRLAGQSG
jgi:hypothetical protein